jgi:hypothetical protein
MCFDHVYCERARAHRLRREDRRARGVRTAVLRLPGWMAMHPTVNFHLWRCHAWNR